MVTRTEGYAPEASPLAVGSRPRGRSPRSARSRRGSRARARPAAARALPPIEFPARTTSPVASLSMKRDSSWRFAASVARLSASGLRPNPGRSSARTRPSRARPGATRRQFRWEPPRPWTRTKVRSPGPDHSSTKTGPSRSTLRGVGPARVVPWATRQAYRRPFQGRERRPQIPRAGCSAGRTTRSRECRSFGEC